MIANAALESTLFKIQESIVLLKGIPYPFFMNWILDDYNVLNWTEEWMGNTENHTV